MKENCSLEKQKQFLIRFLYFGIIIAIISVIFYFASPVLTPFITAFFIAWMLNKPIDWIHRKTNIKRTIVSISGILIFYVVIITTLVLGITQLIVVLKNLFTGIPYFFNTVVEPLFNNFFKWIEELYHYMDPSEILIIEELSTQFLRNITDFINTISSELLAKLPAATMFVPKLMLDFFLTVIATVFISLDYRKIIEFVKRQFPDHIKAGAIHIKESLYDIVRGFLKSYILIMLATFVELWIGLTLIGIPRAGLIAGIIAVIDILPVLGTGSVLLPWSIFSVTTGNHSIAIGLLALYLIITVVRNIIEPRFIGQRVGLNAILTLMSMIIGTYLFGILGLFLFPISLSVLKDLNDRGIIHVFK